MNQLFVFALVFFSVQFSQGQLIQSKRYAFSFETSYDSTRTKEINAFIQNEVGSIELVEILPVCQTRMIANDSTEELESKTLCHFESILSLPPKEGKIDFQTWRPDSIDQTKVGKRVALEKKNFRVVFEALYKKEDVMAVSICYEPRHGICVYDRKGNFLGFVEICFECGRVLSTMGIPRFDAIGSNGFKWLKNLFVASGFSLK